ncbi:hypothetical protein O162_32470 [Pseudomonas putida SJ3]|nr:hypothetical protein O162_32470 [Pseudomonas putida SJ3]
MRQHEHLAHLGAEAGEHSVELDQGFEHHHLGFGAGHVGLRRSGQCFEVSLLQRATAIQVDHQAFGHLRQVVPGGADLIGGTRLEYLEERILHQVRSIAVVAHTLAQPAEQPRAVFDVERADGGRNRRVGRDGGYLK